MNDKVGKLRFGAFVLDPSTGELWRDGARVPLQEHPFRVLLQLLERPGQVVSREDLVTRLWPGTTFIDTDVGLNSAVRKLRIALGDDSDAPVYIETLPRRGYRLLVPVQPEEAAACTTDEPGATAAITPMHAKSRKRRRWALITVPVAAILAIAWWRARGPDVAPISATAHAQRPPVLLLLPFEVPSRDDPMRPRIDGVAETLRHGLGSIPGLRLSVPGRAPTAIAGHIPDLREFDADIALTAQLRGSGPDARLRVQLQRRGNPRPEWSKDYTLATRDLSMAVATMQNDIAQRVLVDKGSAALHAQLTSLETGEYLRAANRAYEGGTRVEDWNDAILHFEQALRRDPDNPRAWCRLSRLYMQWIWTGQKSVEESLAKAMPAIERGSKEHPGLDDCLAARAEAYVVQGKVEEGREVLQQMLELDPDNINAVEPLANYAVFDGYLREANRGFERIVREHPDDMYTLFRLALTQTMLGEDERARASLKIMRDAWPDLAITHHALGGHAALTNDHAGAVRHYEDAAAADPSNAVFGGYAALEALEIGAIDTARAQLDRLGRAESYEYVHPWMWMFIARNEPQRAVEWYRSQRFSPATVQGSRNLLAQALALAGHREEALAEFRRMEQERIQMRQPINTGWPNSMRNMTPENVIALLPTGSADRAAKLRELLAREALYRREGARYSLMDYRAAVHAALAGDNDEAFRLLDHAIDNGYSSAFSLRRDLAWMTLEDDPRFKQRSARLDAIAVKQRERLREAGTGRGP